jgi:hypothetical protein
MTHRDMTLRWDRTGHTERLFAGRICRAMIRAFIEDRGPEIFVHVIERAIPFNIC